MSDELENAKEGEDQTEKKIVEAEEDNKEVKEEAKSASSSPELSGSLDAQSPDVVSALQLQVDDVLKEESQKEKPKGDPIPFKVVYNKVKYDIEFPLEGTVKQLKEHLSPIISVLPKLMKIMIKGLAKDEKTLEELGVDKGTKILVIGSKLNDVVSVNTLKTEVIKHESLVSSQKEPICRQKIHRKVLDKGPPEDAIPGIKGCKELLPMHPLSGMVNKSGGKVRLTFKLELDQLWIGTKERTEKVPMSSINQVVSEQIEGFDQYYMVGLQLGPTEASRYWIYWVPSQYVDAIKETVLGKW